MRKLIVICLITAMAVSLFSASVVANPPLSNATASSSLGAFPPGNAIDNNNGTFYSSINRTGPNHTEWLRADLGSVQYGLSGVTVRPRPNGYGFPANFKIQTSLDGSSWSDAPNASFTNFSNPGGTPVVIPFQGVLSARYVRLYATKLNTDNLGTYYLQIVELSVNQKYTGASSSSTASASFPATNIIDGNHASFFSSQGHAGAANTEYVQVDLGQVMAGINQVGLYPRAGGHGFPADFKIQFSTDGSTWTDAPGASFSSYPNPGSSLVTIPFTHGVSARYIRLYATKLSTDNFGTNYFLQLAELSVDSNVDNDLAQPPASVTGSSELFPASAIIDNNIASFWTSNGHGSATATESFTLKYAQPYSFSKLKLTPRAGGYGFPVNFKLQYSIDGTTFADIPGQSYTSYSNPGSVAQSFTFAPVKAVALRVLATRLSTDDFGANYFFQLAEAGASLAWDNYSDTWVATDDLGRTSISFGQAGAPKQQKFVGMFYWPWHTFLGSLGYGPNNVTEIVANNPGAMSNPNSPPWGPYIGYHYWGEPLYGYYTQQDDYVLARHGQMLADAGVDTIIFDLSNFGLSGTTPTFYFKDDWLNLMDVWSTLRQNGVKTPQVMFIVPWDATGSANAINQLYQDLYLPNLYPDLWFRWEGKPLILGRSSAITSPAVLNFFTFRGNNAGYNGGTTNDWGWLSNYPQPVYASSTNANEQMTVGIAQNSDSRTAGGYIPSTSKDAAGNYITRGRSYHHGSQPLSTDPLSPSYPYEYGYNFAEQWGRALDFSPNFVFVTGWNEWVAARFSSFASDPGPNTFVDQFAPEFSRDIEPMKGGYKDNYYNQLVNYIRLYKGVRKPQQASAPKTIAIDGSFSDWSGVFPEYRDDKGDIVHRNAAGFGSAGTYTDTTGRNDIVSAKVARDNTNIYFYVQTNSNISSYTDLNWMQLFIKTDTSLPNWEGYNYAVNLTVGSSNTTTLKSSSGGWNWSTVNSSISYSVSGNQMEIAIPRANLGLSDLAKPLLIDFKWADNINGGSDAMEFYLHGDAAPNARFNYRFTEYPAQ